MTNQQGAPEALRLAASLELCWGDSRLDEAAAELRRLHAENERLAALVEAQQPAPAIPDTEAFQNFHRLLCARFGYVHDERDWRRDQLSLVEHIARQVQPSPTPQADSQPAPVVSDDELVKLGKHKESGLPPWGIGTTRADYLRAVRAVLAAARAPADSVLEDAARLTYEQAHAIRQGHEISASDGYFEARPQIDSNDRRKVFQAGFERGWDRHAALVEAQQPAPSAAAAVSDEDEALDLLATLFDAWENGTPCYEEPESSCGFLGHAFRLDDEVFHRCADLLNRRRGKQPSPTPQADSQPAPDDFQPCASCFGTGVEGDADDYGRTIDVTCGECDGSGRAPADSVTAPDGRLSDELRNMIEGMSVSVDVSTGDHDAGHRYFGTVTEVMDDIADKHGVVLLVQDAEPNFAPTPPAQAAGSVPQMTAATPSAASIAWNALRDLTDPLGEDGSKIMGHVRVFAQRQYEAGLDEGRSHQAAGDTEKLRKALQFYADGNHFVMHDPTAWDTVSGEPVNFYEDESGTATVEDGSIAKLVLAGAQVNLDDDDEDAPAQAAGSVPQMTAADAQRYAEIEADSGARDFAAGIPQAADSVLEDAALLLESQHTLLTNVAAANLVRSLAARKQGGA